MANSAILSRMKKVKREGWSTQKVQYFGAPMTILDFTVGAASEQMSPVLLIEDIG